jgi:hypothetical protein
MTRDRDVATIPSCCTVQTGSSGEPLTERSSRRQREPIGRRSSPSTDAGGSARRTSYVPISHRITLVTTHGLKAGLWNEEVIDSVVSAEELMR